MVGTHRPDDTPLLMQTIIPACIICPHCGSGFIQPTPQGNTASVQCTHGHRYPIRSGVIDLLGPPQPESIAAWSNEWHITAWAYERYWRPRSLSILSGQPYPYARELPAVSAAIPADAAVILDLACSNGLYARTAAQAHPRATIIGIDRSLPMLIEAQRRAAEAHLAITYIRADARTLPLATASVDSTLIGGSLNEMTDLPRVFAEAARVSAPHATLFSMHLLRSGARSPRVLGLGGITLFGTAEIPDLLRQTGWQCTAIEHTGIVQLVKGQRTT